MTLEQVRDNLRKMHAGIASNFYMGQMADAIDERIKADEMAVPLATVIVRDEGGFPYIERMDHDLPPGIHKLFTHPPAQAAQVDDKVVVMRDGQATTEGLVLAAAIYMGAVKDIFALRSDGPPYNERKVTKDTGALRAFNHLDAATKALRQAIAHFAPTVNPPAQPTKLEDAVREVIADLHKYRRDGLHDLADKLTAALQENAK